MIQEAYCSYEVSKLLKEKGFDEYCRYFYDCETPTNGYLSNKGYGEYIYNSKVYDGRNLAACPTHQMAMAWLREVHNIHTEICLYKTSENDIEPKKSRKAPYYTFGVWDVITGDNVDKRLTNDFIGDTYEDAVEAALKYVLENLI